MSATHAALLERMPAVAKLCRAYRAVDWVACDERCYGACDCDSRAAAIIATALDEIAALQLDLERMRDERDEAIAIAETRKR